jgi:AraC family ethanolamine operon transcriptional activator
MNHPFDPKVQIQLTCHSPEEFQEKAIGWDIEHLQMVRGVYQSSLDLVHTLNMQLSKCTHHVGIRERGTVTPNTITIALPVLPSNSKRPYFCGEQLVPEECPALLPGDDYELFSSGVETYFSIVIDAQLCNTECLLLTGQPFSSLIYSQRVWINNEDQQFLIQAISQQMEHQRKYSNQLSIQQQYLLEKQLAEQLLFTIRPPFDRKTTIPNRRRVAYEAERLICRHAQKHLTIEQLCRFIGCSARTLHLGFKERYGTTPAQYAKIIALNAVRNQLRLVPLTSNVTEVAMSWGFYHLGRFSQQYKQLFDELPSVTIQQNRDMQQV